MASEVDVEALTSMPIEDLATDFLARLRAAVAERDTWKDLAAELRVFESRISGAIADARDVPMGDLVEAVRQVVRERDEARAALIQTQEDHRAAVEALETYEERIGDIADHVLGLVPPDTPTIVKLDAIERRCGEERIAARQAEARVRELTRILDESTERHLALDAVRDAAEAYLEADEPPGRWSWPSTVKARNALEAALAAARGTT